MECQLFLWILCIRISLLKHPTSYIQYHQLPKLFQKTVNCNQHLTMESSSQSLKPIYFH